MEPIKSQFKVKRDAVLAVEGQEFEQYVMCEMLIPDIPNSYGDIYTREAIREFAFEYARQGYGIDVNHDEQDVTGKVIVVESFIAREGDPDFIEGSWVIGMKIVDPDIWAMVLSGELNGYSYQADCKMLEAVVIDLRNRVVQGVTEPDPVDGHTHEYLVVLNNENRPISGGTGETNGHSHTISTHTITDEAEGHTHRFQVIVVDEEPEDDEEDED